MQELHNKHVTLVKDIIIGLSHGLTIGLSEARHEGDKVPKRKG